MNIKRQPIDKTFLTLVLVELFFGFVMLTSASGPLSYSRTHSSWTYALHQAAAIALGLAGMWIFARINYRRWERWAPLGMVAALILMVMVFVPGLAVEYGTAKSWIMIGNLPSIQPVEILKLALVLYLAALLGKSARAPREAFVPACLVFVAIAVLLMLQPDMGSLLIIAGILIAMLFYGGAPLAYLAVLVVAGGGALFAFAKSASYRAARLMVFLHPELDPQGIGYQINQAFLAIGSGGWFGVGLGHSMQKYSYLPEVMNDSIFPIIGEELGFFFALALVVLIVAIFFRGLKIARGSSDQFGRLITIGVVGWIVIQSFINIGAMIGVFPLTGVPLPLVSYGGTAMVAVLWSLGIVLSVSRGTDRAA